MRLQIKYMFLIIIIIFFFVVHFCDILISLYKVVTYNYVSVLAYSMTKSVVIALIVFLVFCGILLFGFSIKLVKIQA